MAKKPKHIAEFGDFQTPDDLALGVMRYLSKLGIKPKAVVEPSCGVGAFLVAAHRVYPKAVQFGLEINDEHLSRARARLGQCKSRQLKQGSFFTEEWTKTIANLPRPLLVVGNPPWVTNAELGALGSNNLPTKSNFQNHKGLDALTGKSNFDISEWMLLKNIEWIIQAKGVLAVLCKTAVARKVLSRAWSLDVPISEARIVSINAMEYFGAAVEACLCIIRADRAESQKCCQVFASFEATAPIRTLGFVDGTLVADVDTYSKNRHLRGADPNFTWRSGLKHDCAKVMELDCLKRGEWKNGFGEAIELEMQYLYPLTKSSDICGSGRRSTEKWVIVPQQAIGQPTREIERIAPKTWAYLVGHATALDARGSIIYKNKPRFSVFGVGPYTFAPWKVAISGLYKKLEFKVYGPRHGKPIVFDDTVYFLPFETEADATAALLRLRKPDVQEFFESMVFWDEKRPITVDLLKRLNLSKLMEQKTKPVNASNARDKQLSLVLAQPDTRRINKRRRAVAA